MELASLFKKAKDHEGQESRFLAIEIGLETVKTAVWGLSDKKTHLVSLGSPQVWDKNQADSLLTATDASLAKAVETLSTEPNQVIFGLPENWVGSGGIADDKKSLIKHITQKLDLKPVGFVVTTEALTHYLKLEEGGPPTTIFCGIAKDEVAVTVVYLGEILGTKIVGRSDDISKDVREGLAHFTSLDTLPSRMLLYDGQSDLEGIKQNLINFDWQDKLPFLHFPKIDTLPQEATIKAIAIAGGTEVAKSLGFDVSPTLETEADQAESKTVEPASQPEKPSSRHENLVSAAKQPEKVSDLNNVPDVSQELGFTTPLTAEPEATNGDDDDQSTNFTSDNLERVDEAAPSNFPPKSRRTIIEVLKQKINAVRQKIHRPRPVIHSSSEPTHRNLPRFHFPRLPKYSFGVVPPVLVFGVIALLLTSVGGAIAYWQLPTASVTIYIKPQVIEKEIELILDPSIEILDTDKGTIPAQKETVSVEGEKKIDTTGDKRVGERAKGEVTLYNRTQSARTFEANTTLTSGNLQFTLDNDVKIASASTTENADFSTTITPSSMETNITAADIGEEFNLGKDTQLSIANFATSSFVAKVTNSISGGSARNVAVVDKADHQTLHTELTQELTTQALAKVVTQTESGSFAVATDEPEITTEDYSANVSEEADTVSLSQAINLPTYVFSLANVGLLMEKRFKADFPDNFKLDSEFTVITPDTVTLNPDGTVLVKAKVTIKLIPNLDTGEVATAIKGRYPEKTESYFSSLPNFSRVETHFDNNLPSRLKTFPRLAKNISIEVKLENE